MKNDILIPFVEENSESKSGGNDKIVNELKRKQISSICINKVLKRN